MRKILKRIFKGLAILLPVIVLLPAIALATPSSRGDANGCTVWREGQQRVGSNCEGFNAINQRLYELEVKVDTLEAQNAQLQARISSLQGNTGGTVQTAPAMDWATLQRILALEAQVKALSAQATPKAIPGCDKRTTGFSVTTGQSCIGNVTKK